MADAKIDGLSYTQLLRLNLLDQLRVKGVPILPSGNTPIGVLSAQSTAAQNPSALDTPIQIEFGAAQGGPSDPVQIDANGTITINQEGRYQFIALFSVTRSSGAGEAYIFIRSLVGGQQFQNPIAAIFDDDEETVPLQFVGNSDVLPQGTTITFELARDSQSGGENDGGLTSFTSSIGWGSSSSASIQVFQFA